jgi:hypothetical protein
LRCGLSKRLFPIFPTRFTLNFVSNSTTKPEKSYNAMSIATPTTRRVKPGLRPIVPDFCPACDATGEPFEAVDRPEAEELVEECENLVKKYHLI